MVDHGAGLEVEAIQYPEELRKEDLGVLMDAKFASAEHATLYILERANSGSDLHRRAYRMISVGG